ncbi:hypothetical protein [Spirillospora sp. CA-128828]|uniref:hypothetical protein n=1 Tax=Spirillospora sp. CA-128828 TaxID=3240033 RepID=UPI003D92C58F
MPLEDVDETSDPEVVPSHEDPSDAPKAVELIGPDKPRLEEESPAADRIAAVESEELWDKGLDKPGEDFAREARLPEEFKARVKTDTTEWAAELEGLREQFDRAVKELESARNAEEVQDRLKVLNKLDGSVGEVQQRLDRASRDLKNTMRARRRSSESARSGWGGGRWRDRTHHGDAALDRLREELREQLDTATGLGDELASACRRARDLERQWEQDSAEPETEPETEPGELSAGTPDATDSASFAPDVSVTRVRLTKDVERVDVQGTGVVVGDGNQQVNVHRYEVGPPRASLQDVLNADPRRLRALAVLSERPDDAEANRRFRRLLSGADQVSADSIRYLDGPGPGSVRISAAHTGAGGVHVHGSSGVVVGDGGFQRNTFRYRVEHPAVPLESALRDDPKLARDVAVLFRHPHNDAVRRSVEDRLHSAYGGGGGGVRYLDAMPGRSVKVTGGTGVLLGKDNTRTDDVDVRVDRPKLDV